MSETGRWELEDADERQRNAPDLYTVPPAAVKATIQVGNRVQLLFLIRGSDQHGAFLQSERLWARVERVWSGGYEGRLLSVSKSSALLKAGEPISFQARHVAAIR